MNDVHWSLRTEDASRHLVQQLLEVWKLLASQQPDTGLSLLDSLNVACRFQPVDRVHRALIHELGDSSPTVAIATGQV
ncbi:hypothetical protein EYF80_027332 [Liparis tanakae]|uniref:Uncharacterized protein n=1 Tax=Liparis tanakae TaxID=230148 RepID=A0A4Z2HC01_9TELE|nr:hypothetical protein EYF80_027332 [Liparis tanakae]